ncbi:MAG: hypothetical protein J0H68_07960 [Sphingobacteriia bacterium]|nr:hypothetical protein [Sphingobacteriia bacterium]
MLAYSFFLLYVYVKYLQASFILNSAPVFKYIEILWTVEDQAIFAGIISFYFGQRTISKFKNR